MSKKAAARFLKKLYLNLSFPASNGGEDTEMRLMLSDVDLQASVGEVKVLIEEDLGILRDAYCLSYLDNAPLEESTRLCDHDVVEGASLRIQVWRTWTQLLKGAMTGDITDCFSASVNIAGSSDWSKYSAWAVLYTAAHRGHHYLVAELLRKTKLAVNKKTGSGWTALHAAARMGRWKVLCIMVDNGAHVKIKNNYNETAFDLSRKHKHKKCENSLSFCRWNLQKHRIVQERKLEYDAANERRSCSRQSFQTIDSSQKIDFRGTQGQLYRAHTPNLVSMAKVSSFERERPSTDTLKATLQVRLEEEERVSDAGGKLSFNYGWFDGLRAQQFIPCTRDVLKYSDPSSCQLWPRSIVNPGGYKVTTSSSLQDRKMGRATKVTFEVDSKMVSAPPQI